IRPNCDAWQDYRRASDPDIISDGNRICSFQSLSAHRGVARMIRRQDLHPWTELAVGPYRDRHNVQQHTAEVEEAARTDGDVIAVVAVEGRADLTLRS